MFTPFAFFKNPKVTITAPPAPYVPSDSDAQAFITAAAITNEAQQTAIDNLVIALKSKTGIWTKMKAIYPVVGGTNAAHKWNLKDPRDLDVAFRLTFNGTINHSSTGMLPDGTSGYSNTHYNPLLEVIDPEYDWTAHFSVYFNGGTTDGYQAGVNIIRGTDGDTFSAGESQFLITLPAQSKSAYAINTDSGPNILDREFPDNAGSGLYVVNRNSSTIKVFKQNILAETDSDNRTPFWANDNFYLLGMNRYYLDLNAYDIQYGTRQLAFATIGDGLTDAEATDLYNAITGFQTALGRAV
jgi:hypothetical protein